MSQRKRQLSSHYINSPNKHLIQTMDNGDQGIIPAGVVHYSQPPPSQQQQQHMSHQLTQLTQQQLSQPMVHGFATHPTHPPPTLTFTQSGCGISENEIDLIAQRVMGCMELKMKQMETKILKGVKTQISALQEENASLKTENESLKLQIDELEQYSRRNAVRITGIPEQDNENTDEIVINLAKEINVDLESRDIGRSHRVGDPKKSKTRPIICKFPTYNIRDKLYKSRKELKDLPDRKGVYINEDLTPYRTTVLFHARQQVKAGRLASCFSSDGRLFIKKTRLSNVIQIHGTQDLSDIAGVEVPYVEPGSKFRVQKKGLVNLNVKPRTSHHSKATVLGANAIMEVTEDSGSDTESET